MRICSIDRSSGNMNVCRNDNRHALIMWAWRFFVFYRRTRSRVIHSALQELPLLAEMPVSPFHFIGGIAHQLRNLTK